MISKINTRKVFLLLGILTIICVAAAPATAAVYKATPENINFLDLYATWAPYGTMYGEKAYLLQQGVPWTPLPVTNIKWVTVGNIRTCTVGNNAGTQYGECVDFAKAVTKRDIATGNWQKGKQVTAGGVDRGTVIATFFGTNNKYKGHVAIFMCYSYDKNQKINGFWVWDQNYVEDELAGKHIIKINSRNTVGDAAAYYVVNI